MVGKRRDDERGQAYTLEGLVGALVILTALLYAMQAVVLTPTTAGTVDQDVKAQLRVEAHDVLVVSADRGELADLALNWNNSTGTFAHAYDDVVGYSQNPPCTMGPPADPRPCEAFGERLDDTFSSQGFTYNLFVDYRNATDVRETDTATAVYRGVPSSNDVVATYTVVLYDNMTLTSPENANGRTLEELGSEEFYADDIDPGPVYNVVEVRLVLW